jgi:hypothetical protein
VAKVAPLEIAGQRIPRDEKKASTSQPSPPFNKASRIGSSCPARLAADQHLRRHVESVFVRAHFTTVANLASVTLALDWSLEMLQVMLALNLVVSSHIRCWGIAAPSVAPELETARRSLAYCLCAFRRAFRR